MPGYTPRHALQYPVGTDLAVPASVDAFVDQADSKLSIVRNEAGVMRYIKDAVHFDSNVQDLSGRIVFQTNITAGENHMQRYDIRGYSYNTNGKAVIDLSVTFYSFSDGQFYSVDVNNNSSQLVSQVTILKRTSDNKIAIAINASEMWQYPKIVVDAWIGTSDVPPSYLTGWTSLLTSDLSAYTHGYTYNVWNTLSLMNNWVPYGGGWVGPRYTKRNGIVHVEGLIRSGTPTSVVAQLPAGFRPAARLIFGAWNNQGSTAAHRVDVDNLGNIYAQHVDTAAVQINCIFPAE